MKDETGGYGALMAGGGYAPVERTQIEFKGADRASFLHNLSTNEVKKLQAGDVRETFITNVQGKTIGHGYIVCRPDSLVFDTVAGQGPFLLAHFEKYHIREKVEIFDRSGEWGELLVASLPPSISANLQALCHDIRPIPFLGPDTRFLSAPDAEISKIRAELQNAGLVECSSDAVESARLEAGTPLFGIDITERNLPQEIARDSQAISFTKGCYLGQETVARIDALGHVNQLLRLVKFRGKTIATPGLEFLAGEKVVGHVTSAAWSPRFAAPLALALLRREHACAGAKLSSSQGEAEVVP